MLWEQSTMHTSNQLIQRRAPTRTIEPPYNPKRPILDADVFLSDEQTGDQFGADGQTTRSGQSGDQPDELSPMAANSVTEPEFVETTVPSAMQLIEMILKDRSRLERIIHSSSMAAELVPRLLTVALAAFTLFGVALAIVFAALGRDVQLHPIAHRLSRQVENLVDFQQTDAHGPAGWISTTVKSVKMISAYDLGLIASAGICLPSLYFYGLLAGIKLSMTRVVVQTLKGMATTAVALVGILPIYMAFALAAAVFNFFPDLVNAVLWMGMILPFVAGLFGVASLSAGFSELAERMSATFRCGRACLLRRLVVSWAACYTAVTPVMIYTLWEYFGRTR